MIDSVAYFFYSIFSGIISFFSWLFSVSWLSGFWALVALILLGYIAWKLWVHYVQQDFISGIDWVLLEIIPPREVLRSPKAMELFISNGLYHWSMKGGLEQYWQGAVWFWFSLEIVSIEGQVHFYVRTPTRVKELIETQLYAQYPQAQVRVAEDYTLAVDEITPKSAWNLWGCEFKLLKPEIFPIRTYVDFGLDKETKEEFKIDPISPIIELFGSLKKGEQMWIQIVIRPSKKKYRTPNSGSFWNLFTHGSWYKYHDWVKQGELEIRKVLEEFTRFHERAPQFGGGFSKEIRAPGFLEPVVKNASTKMTKVGFDTGIRVAYVAKKEIFDNNKRRSLRLIWRQYESPFSNGFTRINSAQADAYGGYWIIGPKKIMLLANRLLDNYRKRNFFHSPLRRIIFSKKVIAWPFSPLFFLAYGPWQTFVLNTEELATLWHFPGQILKIPTLERIESKEATPPPNLPT
jgi:hypothetical protein